MRRRRSPATAAYFGADFQPVASGQHQMAKVIFDDGEVVFAVPGQVKTIKAHHWSGVTLSMKNMFGVVPGARYGWPKNILHWKGIQESVLDLCATVPVRFVIADGIVAMEGNGPLNGTPRPVGKIVLADNPVAADATCARLMGFEADRIAHIREGAKFLGNSAPALIDQLGEAVTPPKTPLQVVPEFQYLHSS